MKKIDVIIYFEHVVRELDACLKLRYELEKRGLSVKIASIHLDRYINIVKYKPKVLILPFFYATKDITYFQYKKAYDNILVLNLHQEQLYNSSTKSFFIPQTKITKNVYHIAWSTNFYNDLIQAGIPDKYIRLTGNPRTDNYYLRLPSRMTKYESKELVFIPTSFSWYFVDEDYFLSNPAIDNDSYYFQRALTEKTVYSFFNSLRKLAREFPSKIFVLRPHPFDPIDKYAKVLQDVDINTAIEENIIINREGNIYEWIRVSELVISWLSTVALEATVFGKKNIIWQPIELPEKMQMSFIKLYDKIYKDYEEVKNIIANPKLVSENSSVKDFAMQSFGRVDGTVNASIADWVCDIINEGCKDQKNNYQEIITNYIKSMMIDAPKRVLRSLGLIKMLPFYKAIEEDLWTVKELDVKYNVFKKESI